MASEKVKQEVANALEVIKKGGIILYPTDTIWGIGCDATNAEAIDKIYKLKQSGDKKSMLVLMDSVDRVALYVDKAPYVAWELMEVTDTPLTLILPGARGLAENIVPEEGTIGVRVPDHEFCQNLVRMMGRPLVSTSANISGQPSPRTFEEIAPEIVAGVDYVVSKAVEGRMTRAASSIVKLGVGGEVEIIRK